MTSIADRIRLWSAAIFGGIHYFGTPGGPLGLLNGGVPWLAARQIGGGNKRIRLGLVYPFFAGCSDFVRFSGEIIIRSLFFKKIDNQQLDYLSKF